MALHSLGANKLRAGLTMLGIIIGTGAVIALLSVGQGARTYITDQIQSIGSNLIFVFPGRFQQRGGSTTVRSTGPLTRQDAEALADPSRSEHIAAVAPEMDLQGTVTYRSESVIVSVIGTVPAYAEIRNFRAQIGDFITADEEQNGERVAVLGSQTATDLFGDVELALDQIIRINRVSFRVVGILEEKGGQGFGGGSRDRIVIIPLTTALRKLSSSNRMTARGERVDYINVSATDEDSTNAAMEEITWILRETHNIQYEEDDFSVTSQKDLLSVFGQITSVLTIFLGAIAGISLLVGGIGIMNIMLVSVTERTREIGIRKALGAKRSDILWQFLVESIVLSIAGGAIGIGFGWGASLLVKVLGNFATEVTLDSVLLAVSFSVAVGLFFGIYPASRASNLHPIDALRYE
jgi:putative ABC transport system permease protein